MARPLRVAVIGGGIGGLAAALALHRRGHEVAVYEQAGEIGEIGGGLNLSPNALKALRTLDCEDAAIEIGFQADAQVIRSWRSGRIISRQKRSGNIIERFGATFLTIHRADLQDVLHRALPDRLIHLGARCTGAETRAGGAVAHFANGRTAEADIVVGADGIRSAVRESLFGADAPRFTGCICWRGLVPVEKLSGNAASTEMTAWWGPHGHIVHYQVRRGELINFVAHCDSDAWTEEGWTHECRRDEPLATYARWNPSLLRLFEAADHIYKWALYDRDPLEAWGKGRISLLGDSAHPMLPYLGQGACMAVEDGCILAEALTRLGDDPEAALRAYEFIRMPRTRAAQLGSRFRAKENHLSSPLAVLRRDIRLGLRARFGKDRTPQQAAQFYDYDVAREDGFARPGA